MNAHFFIYNNEFFSSGTPVISAGNRALRYGDGLFETMRMLHGKIIHEDFHFERLLSGMGTLQMEIPETFTPDFFVKKINGLVAKNGQGKDARIRIMVFRAGEGLPAEEETPSAYIIESWPLTDRIELNEPGLRVDLYADAPKSCDRFSNLKSNNYIISAMAGRFARDNQLGDAVILNVFGRICESSVANIFIIRGKQVFTPPLSEGCVAGVMRRWLLERFSSMDLVVSERPLPVEELLMADEFFLTNSIQPIRWIGHFRDQAYKNNLTRQIFQEFMARI